MALQPHSNELPLWLSAGAATDIDAAPPPTVEPFDGGRRDGDARVATTRVMGVFRRRQLVIRLCFGQPTRIDWRDDSVTHYWFLPGQLFGVAWWARLSPRKQVAGFAVAETLRGSDHGYLVPGVTPAVRVHVYLLSRCIGKNRRIVDRAEALIRRIEREGIEPEAVPASYYRAAGQSLRVGREPRRLEYDAFLRFLRSTNHAD